MLYLNAKPESRSKIYYSGSEVIKTFPLNYSDNQSKFDNEIYVNNLLKDAEYIPKMLDAGHIPSVAWIRYERIKGVALNQVLVSEAPKKFQSTHDKVVLVSRLLLNLRNLAMRGIYWNDLSAHNILISNKQIYLIDFAESGNAERNDHVAMLTWLLHDLQLESPKSYEFRVYGAIHAAGTDLERSRALTFSAPKHFFGRQMQWIYSLVLEFASIFDLLKLDSLKLAKLTEWASGEIRINKEARLNAQNGTGVLDWSALSVQQGHSAYPNAHKSGSAIPAPPAGAVRMPSDYPSDQEIALHLVTTQASSAPRSMPPTNANETQMTIPREYRVSPLFDRVGTKFEMDALVARAERAEVFAQTLVAERENCLRVIAEERADRVRQIQAAETHIDSLLERAERAEVFARSLVAEKESNLRVFSLEHDARARELQAIELHTNNLVDRAERAEVFAKSLLEDKEEKMRIFSMEREAFDRVLLQAQSHVRALVERAERAEKFASSLVAEREKNLQLGGKSGSTEEQ